MVLVENAPSSVCVPMSTIERRLLEYRMEQAPGVTGLLWPTAPLGLCLNLGVAAAHKVGLPPRLAQIAERGTLWLQSQFEKPKVMGAAFVRGRLKDRNMAQARAI